MISVCNKILLSFDGVVLTEKGYSRRGIPSVTLVIYHFKKKVLIPALDLETLTTFPYISISSKNGCNFSRNSFPTI